VRAIKVSVEGDVFEVNATLDILFPEDNWTWDYAEAFEDYGLTQGLPVYLFEEYESANRMPHNKLASSLSPSRNLWGDVYLVNRDTVGATADIISLQDDITVAVVRERIEEARRAAR
jgi:hypothetical protein